MHLAGKVDLTKCVVFKLCLDSILVVGSDRFLQVSQPVIFPPCEFVLDRFRHQLVGPIRCFTFREFLLFLSPIEGNVFWFAYLYLHYVTLVNSLGNRILTKIGCIIPLPMVDNLYYMGLAQNFCIEFRNSPLTSKL